MILNQLILGTWNKKMVAEWLITSCTFLWRYKAQNDIKIGWLKSAEKILNHTLLMAEFILSLLNLQPHKLRLKGPVCLPTKFLELAICFCQICEQEVQERCLSMTQKNIEGHSQWQAENYHPANSWILFFVIPFRDMVFIAFNIGKEE